MLKKIHIHIVLYAVFYDFKAKEDEFTAQKLDTHLCSLIKQKAGLLVQSQAQSRDSTQRLQKSLKQTDSSNGSTFKASAICKKLITNLKVSPGAGFVFVTMCDIKL